MNMYMYVTTITMYTYIMFLIYSTVFCHLMNKISMSHSPDGNTPSCFISNSLDGPKYK